MDVRPAVILVALVAAGLGLAGEEEGPNLPEPPHILRLDVSKVTPELRFLLQKLATAEAKALVPNRAEEGPKGPITLGQAVLMAELSGKDVVKAEALKGALVLEFADGAVMKVYPPKQDTTPTQAAKKAVAPQPKAVVPRPRAEEDDVEELKRALQVGRQLQDRGAHKEALKIFERVCAEAPPNSVEKIDALGAQVSCHAAVRDVPNIRRVMQRLRQELPNYPEYVRLAWTTWLEKAEKELNRAR